jgi:peptidoglycan/LPS O-acetylase OafA/YrhL
MARKEVYAIICLTLCLALALATYFYVENRCDEEQQLRDRQKQLASSVSL